MKTPTKNERSGLAASRRGQIGWRGCEQSFKACAIHLTMTTDFL